MKTKTLNKETITFVLRELLALSDSEIYCIIEMVWNSDDHLEALQKSNKSIHLTDRPEKQPIVK